MKGYDVKPIALKADSPEIKALLSIFRAVRQVQIDTENYDVQDAVSLLINAAGHLLSATDMTEHAIDQLMKGARPGVRVLVAGLRDQGGSRLVTATPAIHVGRA